ncbi:cation:proton antiporter [Oscillatoria sp. CS-180]|uniref:cation:proton antiporter n=1 Tax=Oscillatoria sp. CS-180 TaxID=3021720 RepID=UPI00232C7FEE|nr:cation:proton antiporter [Oscillatoria sp. CS-180]MDB9529408.1 cation:proton antiporter [Oscillatoria sp. CS-180]
MALMSYVSGLLSSNSVLGFLSSFRNAFDIVNRGPIEDPVTVFLVIVGIMLIAPLLFERLKLPGIVGLILAGVVVGPHGLGLLERDETIVLLGTVGLLFLMFLGGLETSLDDLKKNAGPALSFGFITFLLPMVMGTGAMMLAGYGLLAAVLVASCLASHTLIALPVLSKLGIMKAPPVTATLGGTLITNVLALLVLAVVVKAQEGDLTLNFWLFLIPSLIIFTFMTLWGIPRLGRWFFIKFGHDEGAEFGFVLVALFVVSYIAGLIEIEPIVGAFLVGVAITQQIPSLSPLMNRIQFIGNTLFVPFFLISVGMLVDPLILFREPRSLLIAGVIIGAELLSKFLAAWGTGKIFKWPFNTSVTVFGLSVAQAASTLAAVTVAFNLDIVDEATVNGVIVMILVSCILSPWVTERWGSRMDMTTATAASDDSDMDWGKRILIPVSNPETENNLLSLAVLLSKRMKGTLLPLHVLTDRKGKISQQQQLNQQRLLAAAEDFSHGAAADVEAIARVDHSIKKGILRAATERQVSMIICGWNGRPNYQKNLFNSMIDSLLQLTTVPVLIARLSQPVELVNRVVLALTVKRKLTAADQLSLSLAQQLAEELKAPLNILLIYTRPENRTATAWMDGLPENATLVRVQGNPVQQISNAVKSQDLLILPTKRGRYEGKIAVRREPDAIAYHCQKTAMIVVHTPIGSPASNYIRKGNQLTQVPEREAIASAP